jgi:hypothetical protein
MNKQRGMSFWSVSLMLIGVVFVAVIGMKLAPAYIEYGKVKQAISSLKSKSATMSKEELKKTFYNNATIDDIQSVTVDDLVIEKSPDGSTTISVQYQVVVPLMGNVSALLDFSASTDTAAAAE